MGNKFKKESSGGNGSGGGSKVERAAKAVESFLGGPGKIKRHTDETFVATSQDGQRIFRSDHEGHGDKGHFHLEKPRRGKSNKSLTKKHRNYYSEE